MIDFTLPELGRFSCTDSHTKHWACDLMLTDGVVHIATHGAGWFVDLIACSQGEVTEHFQAWSCHVIPTARGENTGKIECAGVGGQVIRTLEMDYLDWRPGKPLVVWVVGKIALLPGEY